MMPEYKVPLSEAAKLEQLAEEASELAQAALKLARIYRKENPTPVFEKEALENLNEEVADVALCVQVLSNIENYKIRRIMNRKYKRWLERLGENNDR